MSAALVAAVAPSNVTAWAAPAAAKGPALQIQVGQTKDLSHIEFHWAGGARFTAKRDGQSLTLHFSRDADPDLSRLRVDPPPFLQTAELRHGKGGSDLVMTLKPGADAKTGEADGAIFVNLFQAPPAADAAALAAAAAAAPRPDPRPANGVVRMKGEIVSGQILLHFPWRAPLGAASFRRGDGIWLVFDTPIKLDVSSQPPQTPIFKGLKVINGATFSAIRVTSPGGAAARAWADGPVWTLAIGPGLQGWPAPIKAMRDDAAPSGTLKAQMAGATKVVWIDDPTVGDRIGAVTALSPSKGLGGRREFVDVNLLPSAQGLAFEPVAEDLSVAFDSDWVRITRPKGLTLSSPSALAGRGVVDIGLPQPASMPALVDYVNWSRTGAGGFLGRYDDLQNAAATEINKEAGGDKQAGVKARMALARFLAGSELSYEAIGVLNLIGKIHPEMMADPEFRGLRGAARAMAGRYKEAANDFSVPVLADDPSSNLWRAYIAASQSDWAAAKNGFVHGMSAMNQFAPAWQARFARAYGETSVQLGNLDVASTEVALALAQARDPTELLAGQLLQARLIEAQGFPKRALVIYDQVARSPLDQLSAPALLHATQIRLTQNQLNASQAEQIYDGLRYRWRGDATELKIIRTLGQLYLSQGHYREALEVMRSAGITTDSPEANALQADLGKAFRVLFLDGAADGMEPVQALALFTDFKDLTPVGADGDLMVRKMVQRLVNVDLLDQASDLLKYQVDNRLDGIPKAQVATDLATLYLMNRKPEQAIEALNNSRTTILPAALNNQRRTVEARAWLALNQNDHALELVGKDGGADSDDIRAEVAWRLHQWPQVAGLMEKLLGERWKNQGAPLSGEEEARLLRAGIAYSLANDDPALDRLRAHFEPMVDKSSMPEALRVALAGTATIGGGIADFSKITGVNDTFAGWVARMKVRFKTLPAPAAPTGRKVAGGAEAAKG